LVLKERPFGFKGKMAICILLIISSLINPVFSLIK
jgi:hypothetical protein